MNRTDRLPTNVPEDHKSAAHGGHGWMMMICCVPMLAIAVVLVVTGVLSAGFLFVALACTAMMAMMMRGMNRGGGM
jgi:Flp pilus assembly protein TadB